MRVTSSLTRIFAAASLTVASLFAHPQTPSPARTIALTFDDLPAMSANTLAAPEIASINDRILATLKAANAPAIGFVNEERLYKPGETDARIAVLTHWLDAGFALGNHTFSHTSLSDVELKDWEDDVIQGESVTRMLQRPRNQPLHYLRHPYLATGPDLKTRRDAEAFLTGRGYRVAPVTVDGFDWFFADLYEDALRRKDSALQPKIVSAWLTYTDAVLTHDEQRCRDLFGYEPKQVLLLHDHSLNADHLPDLLALLRKHGYKFISLDEALTDPVYASPNTYVSDVGADWIEQWAVTRGHPEPASAKPQIPAWAHAAHDKLDAGTVN